MKTQPLFQCRVSSTLNNDVQNFGKKHMFDDNEETCWNSAEGSPQWIGILFEEHQIIKGFQFQFQGGFVGQQCRFEVFSAPPTKGANPDCVFTDFYPEDVNSLQTYSLKDPVSAKFIRIVFGKSTDTYGRIILYKMSILYQDEN